MNDDAGLRMRHLLTKSHIDVPHARAVVIRSADHVHASLQVAYCHAQHRVAMAREDLRCKGIGFWVKSNLSYYSAKSSERYTT